FFLPTGRPEHAGDVAGYWLLQRLARIESALIILVKSDRVQYARRYHFPPTTRAVLARLAEQIERDPRPTPELADFHRAVAWHTSHFDFESVQFRAEEEPPKTENAAPADEPTPDDADLPPDRFTDRARKV